MLKIIVLAIILPLFCFSQNISYSGSPDFLPNTVIFKINQNSKSLCLPGSICDEKLKSYLGTIGVKSLKQKYPKSAITKSGGRTIDLTTIYEITYKTDIPVQKIIHDLKQNSIIEYAVPKRVFKPLYDPNDPRLLTQAFLDVIKAREAWDIEKGDSNNVVIAVSDWGTDHDHEDLIGNVAYNYNDPLNGIDDDGDGYTDNFRGWDFGDNDNDPAGDCYSDGTRMDHGIWVSGISSAKMNNAKGVAGVGGFCKFVHLKISGQYGDACLGTGGYESIVYAADQGYDIINCSWGSLIEDEPYGQEIIDYAFSKNLLVIAAAGNYDANDPLKTSQAPWYPASYNHVMSVAALELNDTKAVKSYYGPFVDIGAPAYTITTMPGNSYSQTYGYTSFATPVVSGCAAIVKSKYPNFNADQIREVLKVTADKIDDVAGNGAYYELLGAGRVNLLRAVTENLSPSVVFHDINLKDKNDNLLNKNDTVYISGLFTNYLSPCVNMAVNMVSSSPYVQILQGTKNLGTMGTMDTASNASDPFRIKLIMEIPPNSLIRLKFIISDNATNYRAVQYIEFYVNQNFVNLDTNKISATITSRGNYGYDTYDYKFGTGIKYENSSSLIYDCGFMIGNSANKLSNYIRQNSDFSIISAASKVTQNKLSDMDVVTAYNDNNNPAKLNIKVLQKNLAWKADSLQNFIIAEYSIINNNNFLLSDLYAGIFTDWDIAFSFTNKSDFDFANGFLYTYSTNENSIHTGIKLLSSYTSHNYAIDQVAGGDGVIFFEDGFDNYDKFHAMTNNRFEAGKNSTEGNDVCNVVSAGPFSISAGDTAIIAFAIMAGENLFVLQNAAKMAQEKYNKIYNKTFAENIPVDKQIEISSDIASKTVTIKNIGHYKSAEIKIIDVMGKEVINMTSNKHSEVINCNYLRGGAYFVSVSTNKKTFSKKILFTNQ